jgi:arylsulfatase A-like enzyme
LKDEIKAGGRIKNNVSHIDLMPTILDLLGVPSPDGMQGTSLAKTLIGGGEPEQNSIYMESLIHKLEQRQGIEVRGLVQNNWKFILTQEEHDGQKTINKELYDLDSGETADLSSKEKGRVADMEKNLMGWMQKLEHERAKPSSLEMSEETKEKLKSLGYL